MALRRAHEIEDFLRIERRVVAKVESDALRRRLAAQSLIRRSSVLSVISWTSRRASSGGDPNRSSISSAISPTLASSIALASRL